MNWNSCLYHCRVMHQRLLPKKHGFNYGIFMFYVDLDELDLLDKKLGFFSRNSFNLYSFFDSDHFAGQEGPCKRKLLNYLRNQGLDLSDECKVFLLTNLRFMGYVFNPVSFYFCFDQSGEAVCAVAEVGNTFREMKTYFIPKGTENKQAQFESRQTKLFYVSPFSDLDVEFDFRLNVPAEDFQIFIDDMQSGKKTLLSSLLGKKSVLSTSQLIAFTFCYPLVTLKIIGLIHWHAILLALKKIPFHNKETNPELQKDLLNPHKSLPTIRQTKELRAPQELP